MKAARLLPFRRPASKPAVPKPPKRWGALSTPIHVADTEAIARAKSILASYGHVDLTADQARAVLRWHNPKE